MSDLLLTVHIPGDLSMDGCCLSGFKWEKKRDSWRVLDFIEGMKWTSHLGCEVFSFWKTIKGGRDTTIEARSNGITA